MKTPRAPAGSTRSSSPSLPNSVRFWIGKLISLTCRSKVDAPPIKLRRVHMRSDIVPGAVFPDYELSDHTAKRRKLSELQGQHPMVLVLSRGGFCPKDRRQAEGLLELHREMEVGYAGLSRSVHTTSLRRTNIVAVSALTGPSSQTQGVSSKKISTSPNIRIQPTIR